MVELFELIHMIITWNGSTNVNNISSCLKEETEIHNNTNNWQQLIGKSKKTTLVLLMSWWIIIIDVKGRSDIKESVFGKNHLHYSGSLWIDLVGNFILFLSGKQHLFPVATNIWKFTGTNGCRYNDSVFVTQTFFTILL